MPPTISTVFPTLSGYAFRQGPTSGCTLVPAVRPEQAGPLALRTYFLFLSTTAHLLDSARAMSLLPLSRSILLLGDSITQQGTMAGGYSQVLSQAYIRKLDVVNRGYGGYNSRFLYEVVKQMAVEEGTKGLSKVALVTLFIGANDSTDAVMNPRQHVALPLYKEKVKAILALFPATVAKILIAPPPSQPDRFSKLIGQVSPDRSNEVTKQYADAIVEVGLEIGVPVVNLFTEFTKIPESEWDRLFSDGLHLTAAGYEILSSALASLIKTKYPALDPDALPMVFPDWQSIDLDNIEESLRYKGD
ncbi:SGNH hydrolase [Calocera viscosa TUFC12733]|uniref:SGNH hydrolase n=1 Tax=Calocera viscosa (strain TUFC12733) TaxID=1330018 RepID=A0A167NJ98_CALVF|nr:SGNH hydrolase [Calocera viscosa TUFC12733]